MHMLFENVEKKKPKKKKTKNPPGDGATMELKATEPGNTRELKCSTRDIKVTHCLSTRA